MALEDDIRAVLDKDLTAGKGTVSVTFRLTSMQIDAIIAVQKSVFMRVKKSPADAAKAKAAELVSILTDWEKNT